MLLRFTMRYLNFVLLSSLLELLYDANALCFEWENQYVSGLELAEDAVCGYFAIRCTVLVRVHRPLWFYPEPFFP